MLLPHYYAQNNAGIMCKTLLWGTGILLPQDFCGKTMEVVAGQPIKKFKFFRIPQSLFWRPSADQKARGLWVRDCPPRLRTADRPRESGTRRLMSPKWRMVM